MSGTNMEVNHKDLILGVMAESQSKRKSGLQIGAIHGLLCKSFDKLIPKVDKWIDGIIAEMVSEGLIEDIHSELPNTTSAYRITDKATGIMLERREELTNHMKFNRSKKVRKPPPKSQKPKKRTSATAVSVEKLQNASKNARKVEAVNRRANSKKTLMQARRAAMSE
eukprot:TRINITY_DN28081_c0_g1_i1.p1 TRINITY_DN28081_c0_g1~~TRINITY_DN28081_c0_g1_i1.p1  ORF type:complete len:189 (+),score=30.15 TRINITY_DN28081_c0_g1_i1:69-569(+)